MNLSPAPIYLADCYFIFSGVGDLTSWALTDAAANRNRVSQSPIGEIWDTSFYQALFSRNLHEKEVDYWTTKMDQLFPAAEGIPNEYNIDEKNFSQTQLVNEISMLVTNAEFKVITFLCREKSVNSVKKMNKEVYKGLISDSGEFDLESNSNSDMVEKIQKALVQLTIEGPELDTIMANDKFYEAFDPSSKFKQGALIQTSALSQSYGLSHDFWSRGIITKVLGGEEDNDFEHDVFGLQTRVRLFTKLCKSSSKVVAPKATRSGRSKKKVRKQLVTEDGETGVATTSSRPTVFSAIRDSRDSRREQRRSESGISSRESKESKKKPKTRKKQKSKKQPRVNTKSKVSYRTKAAWRKFWTQEKWDELRLVLPKLVAAKFKPAALPISTALIKARTNLINAEEARGRTMLIKGRGASQIRGSSVWRGLPDGVTGKQKEVTKKQAVWEDAKALLLRMRGRLPYLPLQVFADHMESDGFSSVRNHYMWSGLTPRETAYEGFASVCLSHGDNFTEAFEQEFALRWWNPANPTPKPNYREANHFQTYGRREYLWEIWSPSDAEIRAEKAKRDNFMRNKMWKCPPSNPKCVRPKDSSSGLFLTPSEAHMVHLALVRNLISSDLRTEIGKNLYYSEEEKKRRESDSCWLSGVVSEDILDHHGNKVTN